MADNRNSKMGLGLFLGMIIGAIGGIFLAPKSGKENREMVGKKMGEMKDMIESGEMKKKIEQIFGNLSDESVKLYESTRQNILDSLEDMKHMNKDDYAEVVQNVIDRVKEGSRVGVEQLKKLKDEFMKEYPEMKKEAEKKSKSSKDKLLADLEKEY